MSALTVEYIEVNYTGLNINLETYRELGITSTEDLEAYFDTLEVIDIQAVLDELPEDDIPF